MTLGVERRETPMEKARVDIPLTYKVSSLCWNGAALIDWAGGNRIIDLQDGDKGTNVNWAYRFDAAAQSANGRYAAIYERFGTKALLLDGGKLVRELNRSFYCAEDYEYPISFLIDPNGRELVAHCPDDYNRIELDDAETGQRLTKCADRKPCDFFHSRLAVSPGGSRLLSAGWVWHPVNEAVTWRVADILGDAHVLDTPGPPSSVVRTEIDDAVFIDEDRLLLSANHGAADFGNESAFRPGTLGVFDLRTNTFDVTVAISEPVGPMLWLGDNHVVGFYETPKIFDLQTGHVVFRWPDLATGKRSGSITGHLRELPPIAVDPPRRRFAVAAEKSITVVQL